MNQQFSYIMTPRTVHFHKAWLQSPIFKDDEVTAADEFFYLDYSCLTFSSRLPHLDNKNTNYPSVVYLPFLSFFFSFLSFEEVSSIHMALSSSCRIVILAARPPNTSLFSPFFSDASFLGLLKASKSPIPKAVDRVGWNTFGAKAWVEANIAARSMATRRIIGERDMVDRVGCFFVSIYLCQGLNERSCPSGVRSLQT